MKFEKYDSYIDSEVDWLGEIPTKWRICRLKDIVSQISIKSSNIDKECYIPLENIESFTGRLLKYSSNDNNEETLLFKKNDILFNKLRPYLAKVVVPSFDGGVSTEAIVMRVKNLEKQNSVKYLLYRFLSDNFISKSNSMTDGVKMPRANPNKILNLELAIPFNGNDSFKIANYLDEKTEKIDKEISILEQKIEKYKELKQTLIAETVLRGLDKNIELRDSETQWIGDIPKHWETDRLKNIFNERAGKNLNIKTGEPVTSNILSVMKDIGVINHRDKGNVGNKMAEDITNYKLVYPNDIVVNKMNVMIGSVGISKEFGALSVIYIILITKKDSYAKYYDYFFRMKAFQKSLRRIATGILEIREAVNMTLFMQEMMTKPSYKEQVEIANYLDEKTSKIDFIVEVIGKKIEVLKEFRKTLINDVVTGKVKVA